MEPTVAQKAAPKAQPPPAATNQPEAGKSPDQQPQQQQQQQQPQQQQQQQQQQPQQQQQQQAPGGAPGGGAPGAIQIPGLEKYRKVERPKETSRIDEIRVTGRGRVVMYVSYIARLFAEAKRPITVRATGKAVSIAVSVVEVAKRRFKGLHQMTTIGVTDIVDEYEPLEAGLEKQSFTRSVTFISVLLTFDDAGLDKSSAGYQAPLPDEMIEERPPEELVNPPRRGGNGQPRGRGGSRRSTARGRGGLRTSDEQADVGAPKVAGPTGGVSPTERNRGRGRGRRSSGRAADGSSPNAAGATAPNAPAGPAAPAAPATSSAAPNAPAAPAAPAGPATTSVPQAPGTDGRP